MAIFKCIASSLKYILAAVIYFMHRFITYCYDIYQNPELFPRFEIEFNMTEFILSKPTMDISINIIVFFLPYLVISDGMHMEFIILLFYRRQL